jgi:hypothetical protein
MESMLVKLQQCATKTEDNIRRSKRLYYSGDKLSQLRQWGEGDLSGVDKIDMGASGGEKWCSSRRCGVFLDFLASPHLAPIPKNVWSLICFLVRCPSITIINLPVGPTRNGRS